MAAKTSTPASEETVKIKKESGKNVNRTGLLILIIIFTIALFLTFQAVFQKSSNKSGDDVTSPTGKIISPTTGTVVNSNILPIKIDASDDLSGVKSVEIFYKSKGVWEKLATLTQPPYIYNWDISNLSAQAVTLDIHITDNAGNIQNTNNGGWQEDIVLIPINKGKIN